MSSNKSNVYNLGPQKVLRNLLQQKTEGIFCDIKLCLQGAVLWAHACVLAPFSSYVMELFNPNSDTNHWCPQKPLVIDLDVILTVSQDKCVLCLSTLVNFLYSQDLVILDGHLQHFIKIIYCLKIVDLFPMFNTYFENENAVSLSKESDAQELSMDCVISHDDLLKTDQIDKSDKFLSPLIERNYPKNSFLNNISEIKKSIKNQADKKTQLNATYEINESCDRSGSILSSSENVNVVVEEHNYGTNLKLKCEFLCCADEVVSSNSQTGHKRKISCEMCSFTAVSVKKVLKHIEGVNHLGTFCPICTQKFQNADKLQKHLSDHNNSKPYLCQFCSKRTRFWEFYKTHLKVHCRRKQFYCKICERSFKNQQNLKVHLKNHQRNYLCSSCNYLTSDVDAFKAHLLIHKGKALSETTGVHNSYDNFMCISDNDLIEYKTAVQFLCNFCGDGFTQKSNLKRHIELKHSNIPSLNCFKCTYTTKRIDLLKSHMKRHHNCLPEEVEGLSQKVTKKSSKKQKLDKDQSEVVGVLIPVQLVSNNDSSTLNVFAVKTCISGELENVEDDGRTKLNSDTNENDSSRQNTNSTYVGTNQSVSNNSVENKFGFAGNCHMNGPLEACVADSRTVNGGSDSSLFRNNKAPLEDSFEEKIQNIDSNMTNLQLNLNTGNSPCNKNIDISQPVLNISQEFNDLKIALGDKHTSLNSIRVEPDLLTRRGEFWLNEATGELLDENSLVNVQVIDTSCRFQTVSSSAENPKEVDPLHTLILSDASKTVSILDLRDDVDEFKSNPQTPQTNLVEVDDPDNLFPWSRIDSNFCSTWVLNEATGELNMVSFNVQPIKHSDESKLDENTGIFSPKDDDETALFLNEGTGDLSVIYFNPGGNQECDSSKQFNNEQGIQDIPDNISEHSNDAEDFLNEEFFKATASFMAHKENETFLNELTGEFDTNVADFSDYHPDLLESQISGSESYLNEETGEILWNVLNKNVGSDFFTNSENFKFDPDDSLNCDDFEPFADEINDFSSQFCLEPTQDWQTVDETCDILLNECTGELVKKN